MNDASRSGDNAGLQNFVKLHLAIALAARSMVKHIGAATIVQDVFVLMGECPFAGKIESVSYIPNAAFAGADTNTRKFSLVNRGTDGLGNVLAANLQMNNAINFVAKDKAVITLSGTTANLNVLAGDVLEFQSFHVGTGIIDSGGLVIITLLPT